MFWKSEFTNLGPEAARRFLGPTIVDEQIRSAINMMIVFAGPRRKTVNQVEAEVRQIGGAPHPRRRHPRRESEQFAQTVPGHLRWQ